ncbi:hypothetical protein Bca4012_022368 [Brassica carinata]
MNNRRDCFVIQTRVSKDKTAVDCCLLIPTIWFGMVTFVGEEDSLMMVALVRD